MSPEKAKVFIAEDDKHYQSFFKKLLEKAGHTIVASATNLPEALGLVERLGELNVDVAVIDGNLNEYDSDGHDGQSVLRAIREHAPRVKTVGMSGNSVRGTDVDLGKANLVDIGEVVKKL